jgi:hypothetical protein
MFDFIDADFKPLLSRIQATVNRDSYNYMLYLYFSYLDNNLASLHLINKYADD